VHAWNDQRHFIIDTPAVGLVGVAVKLRLLIHPVMGLGDLESHATDVRSLATSWR